jgi:hypothetical protein
MAKDSKSRAEIEALLLERCRPTMNIAKVTIFGTGSNWDATFSSNSHLTIVYVPKFRAMVSAMREAFDLKPD